jgi:hypothetical protein
MVQRHMRCTMLRPYKFQWAVGLRPLWGVKAGFPHPWLHFHQGSGKVNKLNPHAAGFKRHRVAICIHKADGAQLAGGLFVISTDRCPAEGSSVHQKR